MLICLIIAISFFVVYFWRPEEKKQDKKPDVNNRVLNYVEIDTSEYGARSDALKPCKQPRRPKKNSQETLQQLDEYVRSLREHRINQIDDV